MAQFARIARTTPSAQGAKAGRHEAGAAGYAVRKQPGLAPSYERSERAGAPQGEATRQYREARPGHDFSSVRIHAPQMVTPGHRAHSASGDQTAEHAGRQGLLQKKLHVNSPGDREEQEAERVADQVMEQQGASLQRACACSGASPAEAEWTLQRNAAQREGAPAQPAPSLVESVLRTPGQPLDTATRSFFEPRMGYSFRHVRVHTDAEARQSADLLNARAYTVGRHIVFGRGPAAAHPLQEPHLTAHELTHVVQQGAHDGDLGATTGTDARVAVAGAPPAIHRAGSAPRVQRAFADTLEYEQIAARIHRAIAGLGTDEEAVYQALQQLQQDEEAIRRLRRIYVQRYGETLDEAIDDDFSGDELEFALQLLVHKERDPKAGERIEARPARSSDWQQAARRLYEAMPGTAGTEEEAVFAVLVPLNKEPAQIEQLRRAYQRLDPMGLTERLQDEMSGEELDYAMSLLAPRNAYGYFLRRGHEELAGRPEFGLPVGEWCNKDAPDKQELYDRRYWEEDSDLERGGCKLRLKSGLRPSLAVESMFEDADEWKLDCAQFVQVLHLYALLHTLGPFAFDRRFGGGAFELRMADSTWIKTETLWFRETPTDPMQPGTRKGDAFEPSATLKPRPVEHVLAEAPVGSRVMWHNKLLERSMNPGERAFIEENTLKLGDNAYSAHPLSSSAMTREAIEEKMGGVRVPKGLTLKDVIRKYVFIREIEVYRQP